MKKVLQNILLGSCLVVVAASASAAPIIWDLTGQTDLGNLGKDEIFLDTTATHSLTATAINTEEGGAPVLVQGFGSIAGLGVYTGNCQIFGGDGCGEIDNTGDDEGIVLDFGSIFDLESLTIANLGAFDIFSESYNIFGTNDSSVVSCTTGGLSCFTNSSTLIASGSASIQNPINLDLTGNSYQYVIATLPGGSGDSFRINSVSASAKVPEPSAIALLVLCLAGIGTMRKIRKY